MKKLTKSWFWDGDADLEHKQYVLLAYLQYVNRKFTKNELYPHLSGLVKQYRNLKHFIENERELYDNFPGNLSGFDWQQFKLAYERVIEDDELMESIRTIVNWSLPKIKKHLEEGRDIHEYIETQVRLMPVGIEPLHKDEGYFLIQNGVSPLTRVFRYAVTLFEHSDDGYRGINTLYLRDYKKSISTTEYSIKKDLIKSYRELPNPATYSIEAGLTLPLIPTLLPVVERLLIRHISKDKPGYSSSVSGAPS